MGSLDEMKENLEVYGGKRMVDGVPILEDSIQASFSGIGIRAEGVGEKTSTNITAEVDGMKIRCEAIGNIFR